MGKVSVDPTILVEALRLWTGYGSKMCPDRNDDRVIGAYGKESAERLLEAIKGMEADFYSTDANFVARDMEEMAVLAMSKFRQMYPAINDDVAKIFAWCYTFDFK